MRSVADTSRVESAPDSLALLAAWLLTLEARDLSPKTMRLYTYGIFRLLEFHRFTVHPVEMDEQHIVAFLASLGQRTAMKEHYAKGIRSFCAWMRRRGYTEVDPIAEIRAPRRQRPEPVRFERSEMSALIEAANARDPRRGWAILGCLGLGTRRSEFVNIRRDQIDWGAMKVRLTMTKGGRPRAIPIGPWAEEALRALERVSPRDQPYLLPIEASTLNSWVHDAAEDAGIVGDRKQRAHTLRATFASWLLDDGVPIHVVSKLLGHANIATTSAYAAVGPGSAEEAVAHLG
jgi:integrase/recombinase XerD